MTVIDKRPLGKSKSENNRKRFIDRHRQHIKESVDQVIQDKSIKDIGRTGAKVGINKKHLNEPNFKYNTKSGKHNIILPGNRKHSSGDTLPKPQEGGGRGRGGSNSTDVFDDEFTFTLTKDEFIEIYFKDMELPRFIKESLKHATKIKYLQSGTVKQGNPARLHLKKTFEQAVARKIATKRRTPYLDDMDLRYRHLVAQPKPIARCVMFCLMDVSGSMGEHEKTLAKKFFILLYLFLFKTYESVEIRFIRHTTEAQEVEEDVFFHSRETGGTVVSSGLLLINDIISKEYNLDDTNIYIAQASDGDNWDTDDDFSLDILEQKLLPVIQYFAYIQVESELQAQYKVEHGFHDLYTLYETVVSKYDNLNIRRIQQDRDVYPVLHELFKKATS